METEKLVIKGAELKAQVAAATAELREINNQLAGLATFKDGNKTGDIVAGGYRVKVTMRDNIKYDQTRPGGHPRPFRQLQQSFQHRVQTGQAKAGRRRRKRRGAGQGGRLGQDGNARRSHCSL